MTRTSPQGYRVSEPVLSTGQSTPATQRTFSPQYPPAPPEGAGLAALMARARRQVREFEEATQEKLSETAAKEMTMTFY